LGRQLAAQGHTARLISPEYGRPYVKAQKNDDRDAEAIAEAATALANELARIAWAVLATAAHSMPCTWPVHEKE
jgi:transposase